MSKSTEQELLEEIVLSSGLAWLKAQQEELQTSRLARALSDNPSSNLVDRYDAHSQTRYAAHQSADAEFKLVQALARLADVIGLAAKEVKP